MWSVKDNKKHPVDRIYFTAKRYFTVWDVPLRPTETESASFNGQQIIEETADDGSRPFQPNSINSTVQPLHWLIQQ